MGNVRTYVACYFIDVGSVTFANGSNFVMLKICGVTVRCVAVSMWSLGRAYGVTEPMARGCYSKHSARGGRCGVAIKATTMAEIYDCKCLKIRC